MTDDIVARLRGTGGAAMHSTLDRVDAADEIERLRAELAAMKTLAYDRLLQVEAAEAERAALYRRVGYLEECMRQIANIENKVVGGDWDEIEEARRIVVRALNRGGGDE